MGSNFTIRDSSSFLPRSQRRWKTFFRIFLLIFFLFLLSPNSRTQIQIVNLHIEKFATNHVRPGGVIQFALQITRLDKSGLKALDVRLTDILDENRLSYISDSVEIIPLFEYPVHLDVSHKINIKDDFSSQTSFPLDETGFSLGDISKDFREFFEPHLIPKNPIIGIQVNYKAKATISVGTIRNTANLLSSSVNSGSSNCQSTSLTFVDPFIDCQSTSCPQGTNCSDCGSTPQTAFKSIQQVISCINDPDNNVDPNDGDLAFGTLIQREPIECSYDSFKIPDILKNDGVTKIRVDFRFSGDNRNPLLKKPRIWNNNDVCSPVVKIEPSSNEDLFLQGVEIFDADGFTNSCTPSVNPPVIEILGGSSFTLTDSFVHSNFNVLESSHTPKGLLIDLSPSSGVETLETKILRTKFTELREKGIEIKNLGTKIPDNPKILWSLFKDLKPIGNEDTIWIDLIDSPLSPSIRNCSFLGEDAMGPNKNGIGIQFGTSNVPEITNSVFGKLKIGINQTSGTSEFSYNAFGDNQNSSSNNVTLDKITGTDVDCNDPDLSDCINITDELKPGPRSILIGRGFASPNADPLENNWDFGQRIQPVDGDKLKNCAGGNFNEGTPCNQDNECDLVEGDTMGKCVLVGIDIGAWEYHRKEIEKLSLKTTAQSNEVFLSWSDQSQSNTYRIYGDSLGAFYNFDPGSECKISSLKTHPAFMNEMPPFQVGDDNNQNTSNFVDSVSGNSFIHRPVDPGPGSCRGFWYMVLGDSVRDADGSVGFDSSGLNREFIENDNCPLVENPSQNDSDSDGVGFACDCDDNDPQPKKCQGGISDGLPCNIDTECNLNANDGLGRCVLDLDSDFDGIRDACDNCLSVFNPSQSDNNGNEIGDACEDEDNDGILATEDNCLFKHNVSQSDCDMDCPLGPFNPDPALHPNCGDACDNDFGIPIPLGCPNPSCSAPGKDCGDFSFRATGGLPGGPTDPCAAIRITNNSNYVYTLQSPQIIADCTTCTHTGTTGCPLNLCGGQTNPKSPNQIFDNPFPSNFSKSFTFFPFHQCCDNAGSLLFCSEFQVTEYRHEGDLAGNSFISPLPISQGFDYVGAVPEGHSCLTFPSGTFDDGVAFDNCPLHYNPKTCEPGNINEGKLCDLNSDCDKFTVGDEMGICEQLNTDGMPDGGDACDCDDDDDGCPDQFDGSCVGGPDWFDTSKDENLCKDPDDINASSECAPPPLEICSTTPLKSIKCSDCVIDCLSCEHLPVQCP